MGGGDEGLRKVEVLEVRGELEGKGREWEEGSYRKG